MTDQQPHTPPECDHHWISYMQPSTGLSWIRQCSQCGDFDADDLREQVAAAEQRGAERALREAAEHLGNHGPLTVTHRQVHDYLRNRADQITTQNDQDRAPVAPISATDIIPHQDQ